MKKLVLILLAVSILACSKETPKDYVTLSGKVENQNSETLTVMGKNFRKDIQVDANGNFQDTLKVVDGFHGINDGKLQSFLYLKNGYDLQLNFDVNDFPASIKFEGEGAVTNNYLTNKLEFIKEEKLDNYAAIFSLEEEEFTAKMEDLKIKFDDMLAQAPSLEPEVVEMEAKANADLLNFYTQNYQKEHDNYTSLQKGQPSPKFNYPDVNGKNVSLDDLKGKYVYVDVWATWCGPCKREIPFLKELDSQYKGKELAIVSLSIDKMEHKEKWLNMVKQENLQGIQIMADNEWNSEFVSAYNITGIPRFILIDPEGNIFDANAPRPSDPRLQDLLKSLNI